MAVAPPVLKSLPWSRWDHESGLSDGLSGVVSGSVHNPPAAVAAPAPAAQPVTPVTTTTSSGTARTYVIVEGDTLAQIAQRFNTTVAAIMQANNIADQDLIFWGMALTIP